MNQVDSQREETAVASTPETPEQAVFRALFEEAPVPYYELDGEGFIRRVNQAYCDLLEYTPEEMLGQPVWAFADPPEQELSRLSIARKLAGVEDLTPCRRNYVSKQHRLITVEIHSTPIVDQRGNIAGVRTALFNITEQVALEAATLQAQQWLATTLDALTEGVIAVDPLGTVRFMNRFAAEITGWPAEEAAGCEVGEILKLQTLCYCDRTPVTLAEVVHESFSGRQNATALLIDCGGKLFPVKLTVSPMLVEGDKVAGIIYVFREWLGATANATVANAENAARP